MTGALLPLPIPLRADPLSGLSASQLMRLSSDLAAISRTLPFARVTFDSSSAVENYQARPPGVDANAPVVTTGAGSVTITWPLAMLDESGAYRALRIVGARYTVHGADEDHTLTFTPNSVTVTQETSTFTGGTLVVFARWGKKSRFEDYGGSPDKTNSRTEATPYAWLQYRELGASLGTAYGDARVGSIHARRLAYARGLAAVLRSEDRRRFNSTPDTAHAKLGDWAKSLRVPVSADDPAWLIRKRCAVMYSAKPGQSLTNLQDAIYQLIGSRFVRIRKFDENDEHGPWPIAYAFNGEVFATNRARIIVDVKPPLDHIDQDFRDDIQIQLIQLLDRLVPAHIAFDWAAESDGFFLGISRLSIDAF